MVVFLFNNSRYSEGNCANKLSRIICFFCDYAKNEGLVCYLKSTKKPELLHSGFLRTNKLKFIGLSQSVHRFYKIFVLLDGLISKG